MSDYPVLSMNFDMSTYQEEVEDQADRSEMEGGYEITRPRFTRPPRVTFSFAYKNLPDEDKVELDNFFKEQKGGSNMFDWINPVDNTLYTVRFGGKVNFKWAGVGLTKRWDTDTIMLKTI